MLGLLELRRAVRVIREGFLKARLRRITQLDVRSLVLTFEASGVKSHLLLSIHPEFARICLVDPPEKAVPPGSFCEYVRAHLIGCCLAGIDIRGDDRQVRIDFRARSCCFVWIFSILGARSNCYLLDAGGKIVHCMRPLEETRRELKIGGEWADPRGAAPAEGTDRWEGVPDAFYLQEIGKTYAQLENKRKAELMVRRIEHAIRKERSFLQRKFANLQEDLEAAREAETFRQKGELLKHVLHNVRTGDSEIWATDYQAGESVEIPLDPKLSPAANLESYFARYQKESRKEKMIRQQLKELESARAALNGIEALLAKAREQEPPAVSDVEGILSQPAVLRLVSRHSANRRPERRPIKPASKRELPARLRPKRYKTEEGLEIWVGRGDEGNDYLTTRLARGNDLFFHLEGYPGSHVILRTEGHKEPSPSSLLDACELAVHFSRLKTAGSADVHVAAIKDVKKPKGAKPGLVYVRGGKTIHLRRDAKRLQDILATRFDD